jgi:hypothetical protein
MFAEAERVSAGRAEEHAAHAVNLSHAMAMPAVSQREASALPLPPPRLLAQQLWHRSHSRDRSRSRSRHRERRTRSRSRRYERRSRSHSRHERSPERQAAPQPSAPQLALPPPQQLPLLPQQQLALPAPQQLPLPPPVRQSAVRSWYYNTPCHGVQGPFSLVHLQRWREQLIELNQWSTLRVWRVGQQETDAVLVSTLLPSRRGILRVAGVRAAAKAVRFAEAPPVHVTAAFSRQASAEANAEALRAPAPPESGDEDDERALAGDAGTRDAAAALAAAFAAYAAGAYDAAYDGVALLAAQHAASKADALHRWVSAR